MLTVRRRTVVVNLIGGTTVVGDRRLSWPWQVKLTGARMHPGPGHPEQQQMDGAVLIPWDRIEWIQVVS